MYRALVLASGGLSRDVKMRMDFNPGLVPEYGCTNHRGATGEMIRYARAIGADVFPPGVYSALSGVQPRRTALLILMPCTLIQVPDMDYSISTGMVRDLSMS